MGRRGSWRATRSADLGPRTPVCEPHRHDPVPRVPARTFWLDRSGCVEILQPQPKDAGHRATVESWLRTESAPMLTIFFSGDDVARTRVAPAPDPLWETVLSLHVLRNRRTQGSFGPWRDEASERLRRARPALDLRLLLTLNPPTGYFPDFLTPSAGFDGLGAGLDALAATSPKLLRRDLEILALERRLPVEAGDVARGDGAAMTDLTRVMRAYFEVALAPHWSTVESVVDGDRARRVRAIAGSGAAGLLESLRPAMRWHGDELHVDYPFDRELHLGGRGLLLVPSYFCWRYPVTLLDPNLPPVLVYPAERPVVDTIIPAESRRALGALLGNTRAAALAAVGEGCTTSELARRIGVSAAAASQHATVLRNAGLVTSHRDRNMVVHSITPLGTAVLKGR
jgi:DNA-binding transcriptional ArsR family regulator